MPSDCQRSGDPDLHRRRLQRQSRPRRLGRDNGWRKADKKPALNPDLWQELLALLDMHQVKFLWLRGHDGHPENERADQLAVTALRGPELAIDRVYEAGK